MPAQPPPQRPAAQALTWGREAQPKGKALGYGALTLIPGEPWLYPGEHIHPNPGTTCFSDLSSTCRLTLYPGRYSLRWAGLGVAGPLPLGKLALGTAMVRGHG